MSAPALSPAWHSRIARLGQCFFLAFPFYLIIQFLITGRAVHNIAFYALLLPSLLAYGWNKRETHCELLALPAMKGFLLFFAYIALHALLFLTADAGKIIHNAVDTGFFFAATAMFFGLADIETRQKAVRYIAIAAGIASLVSLVQFAIDPPKDFRLVPIGRAEAALPAAAVYCFGFLTGLLALHETRARAWQAALLVSVAACFAVIMLTQARLSGFVAVLGLLVMCASLVQTNRKALVALLALLAVALLIVPALIGQSLSGFVQLLVERGNSYRFELWQLAWEKIQLHPWIGTGESRIEHHQSDSPHNVFLATAMLMGLPALALLLATLVNLALHFLKALRLSDPYHRFVVLCLVNGMGLSMIDYNRVISGSSPLWIIFWLPLGLALATLIRERELAKLRDA